MSKPETDLRQGVTPTQHAVLDMIEQQGAEWGDLYDFEAQLIRAADRAKQAVRSTILANKRRCAIEAAARLIDAADEIGRLIDLEGVPA
jgi:hypothetical protein